MAARKRKKQREEFVDYIAIIDRTDLHYSINHHRIGKSRVKALLLTGSDVPFSLVVENYRSDLVANDTIR